jgi:hypothetical protein
MKYGLILILWSLTALLIFLSGFLASAFILPQIGEYPAHIYKVVVATIVIAIFSAIYALRSRGEYWRQNALTCGAIWLLLSIFFEFVLRLLFLENPWKVLISDYQIWKGRLWILVLIVQFFGPLLWGYLINRRKAK